MQPSELPPDRDDAEERPQGDERNELDCTRADICLVDQHGKLLGRPWITTVIDTYSRSIIGFNISFNLEDCTDLSE